MLELDRARSAALRHLEAKVLDLTTACRRRQSLSVRGLRLVLTNGVFDLLHAGHVGYLATARELGDALFVGLNDDASVRRNRGPERPLQPLADRALVLAGLAAVDAVVPFGEATAEELVTALRPEIYVKGADYSEDIGSAKPLPEAPAVHAYGGRIALITLLPGRSTSDLIARVMASGGR